MDKLTLKLCILSTLFAYTFAQINPSILQDTRDLPKLDGTFGFLYRTEDGIAHAAKADPGGVVHGRFTYTDPTGLKVNYNYNAGSSATPKYNYNAPAPAPAPQPQTYQQPQNYQQPQQNQQQPTSGSRPPALRYQDNGGSNNNNYADPYDNNVNNYDSNQYFN